MVTIAQIREQDAWEALAPEWSELVERCPNTTPFQRPEWLLAWWREFGSGQMAVLAFREDGRLAGLLPLFVHPWNGRRQVTLIGSGVTDYLGLTAEPGVAGACAGAALDWIEKHRDLWDVCDWQDLRGDSPLLAAPSTLERHVEPDAPCTAAPLPDDGAVYDASLPHGLRRTIRISARRLERQAALEFETLRSDDDAATLEQLYRLHQERWAGKGGPQSMLDSPATQRFLTGATRALSRRGMIRLYVLRYRREICAVIYGILDRNVLYGYITGMDPELAKFSPGSLLLHYAVQDAIREGARAWDFLRGDEEYKFQWGAQRMPKFRLRLLSRPRLRTQEDTPRELSPCTPSRSTGP